MCIQQLVRTVPLVTAVVFAMATSSAQGAGDRPPISATVFEECRFAFDPTQNVDRDSASKAQGSPTDCSIPLRNVGTLHVEPLGGAGERLAPVSLSPRTRSPSEVFADYGFEALPDGTWKFVGNPFSICDKKIRFSHLTTTKDGKADDFTLVGRQTEAGCSQNGAPITFQGAYIVRATDSYYVTLSIAYEVAVPKNVSDQITADLIKVVKSVRVRTE